tara:strand:- start:2248 stop:2634 length:387 start_codon:yes stop_codon:yes gene_type:complete
MAQSLENKFKGGGSALGYPNNPSQPVEQLSGPSAADLQSTLHDLYSYDGNPKFPTPIYPNTGKPNRYPGTISPTQLQAFTGPQNTGAAAAGFRNYNNQSTYDDFVLAQGATDGVDRLEGSGQAFVPRG